MVTIYHNPRCSKSRTALALLRDNGVEPTIIEYLKTPPDGAQLADILTKLNLRPRDMMRRKEVLYRDLNLDVNLTLDLKAAVKANELFRQFVLKKRIPLRKFPSHLPSRVLFGRASRVRASRPTSQPCAIS